MTLETIHNDTSASVQADLQLKYIQIIWNKHPKSESFRKVITLACRYALQHDINKWLCNMQEILTLSDSDQKWLVNEIFTAFNPNLKHDYAYVISPMVSEIVTTYRIHDLVQADQDLKNKVSVEIFFEIETAQQWLFTSIKQIH